MTNRGLVKVAALAVAALGFGLASERTDADQRDRLGEKLKDVELRNLDGETVTLLSLHTEKVLVIAYTGLGCPISGRYAPRLEALQKKFADKGVRFVGINANPHDKLDKIAADAKELGITFPILQDHTQALTRQLDAKTTTVAFVFDKNRILRYRGMIDDQYAIAAQRTKPRKKYLERAVRAALRGKDPETTKTPAPGCLITRLERPKQAEQITYSSHIARIIQDKCQSCHRPTQVGPFPLMTYESVVGWSAMIHNVVQRDRMPPWNAHPDFDGVFVNERKLSKDNKAAMLAWIESGMPRGNAEEDPPRKSWPNLWRIGKPDHVFAMQEVFDVPREGVVPYQYFRVPVNFQKDYWVKAMEAKPGAADVVHHIIAFTVDRQGRTDLSRLGLDDGFLCGHVPGDIPSTFPPGYGKRIPAGHDLILQVHYTTNGKRRKDKCKIALVGSPEPEHEVRSRGIYNLNFKIPAGARDYEVRADHTFNEDVTILSFYPHMHFRGKDWKYIAHYSDGTQKTLLFVPNYDYNWQELYVLREPLLLLRGTRLECIAHYDNSTDNFINPDPTKTVKWGDQSWDEMMIGYVDYVAVPQGTN